MPDKIENILPWIFVGIGFLLVSLLVTLTGGHPFWIRKKLRLGGILLGLTAVASGISCGTEDCYDSTPNLPLALLMTDSRKAEELISLEDAELIEAEKLYSIQLDPSGDRLIHGTLSNHTASEYSFTIMDSEDTILQQEDFVADDEAFDSVKESFTIQVSEELQEGSYRLLFFHGKSTGIDPLEDTAVTEFQLLLEAKPSEEDPSDDSIRMDLGGQGLTQE